jgi:hypothetical protein
VGYYDSHHELRFILTSKDSRDFYSLYGLVDGNFRKLGKARSPTELEEKFRVYQRMEEHGG